MSKRIQWITGYVSEGATASASSTAAGNYQARNVVDLDRTTLWKANTTGAENIALNLGSAKAVTAFALGNHNADKWTGGKLQRSPDGSAWTDVAGGDVSGVVAGGDYFRTFASVMFQHYRIVTTSSTEAMKIGVFYLGLVTELSKNPGYPFIEEDVWNVERASASSRAIVAEEHARRLGRFDMLWPTLRIADRDQLRTLLRAEGGPLRPFWFVPAEEGAGVADKGQAYLVRQQPISIPARRRWIDTYEMAISLLEEV